MYKTGHLLSGCCQRTTPCFHNWPNIQVFILRCFYFETGNVERKSGAGQRLRLRNWRMEGARRTSSLNLSPWTAFELTREDGTRGRSWWNYSRGALRDLSIQGRKRKQSLLPLLLTSALFLGSGLEMLGAPGDHRLGVGIQSITVKLQTAPSAQAGPDLDKTMRRLPWPALAKHPLVALQ